MIATILVKNFLLQRLTPRVDRLHRLQPFQLNRAVRHHCRIKFSVRHGTLESLSGIFFWGKIEISSPRLYTLS
ncbi:MAG: hypothetical protein ACD_75C00020G0002 [uncultured bacterium]|nr:MAG: hypothetical protein ACD_75C00020G0002 [uncultured bacterium]